MDSLERRFPSASLTVAVAVVVAVPLAMIDVGLSATVTVAGVPGLGQGCSGDTSGKWYRSR